MKKDKIFYFCLVILSVTLMECSVAKSQSSKKDDRCEEDVARYRPKYSPNADTTPAPEVKKVPEGTVVPQKEITEPLNVKMDTLSQRNSLAKNAPGYRILVYSGRSSDDVKKTRTKVYDILPDADIYTEFNPPNQKVKVGNCIDRQEAFNLLGKLKKSFPYAVIVPDKVVIKAK